MKMKKEIEITDEEFSDLFLQWAEKHHGMYTPQSVDLVLESITANCFYPGVEFEFVVKGFTRYTRT